MLLFSVYSLYTSLPTYTCPRTIRTRGQVLLLGRAVAGMLKDINWVESEGFTKRTVVFTNNLIDADCKIKCPLRIYYGPLRINYDPFRINYGPLPINYCSLRKNYGPLCKIHEMRHFAYKNT